MNLDNLRGGRFGVQRAIFDHAIWRTAPKDYFRVWIYLFGMAAWKTHAAFLKGPVLPRGSIYIGERKLAAECRVSRRIVRDCLRSFVHQGMVILSPTKKAQLGTLITICNYESYQSSLTSEGPPKRPSEGPVRAQRGPKQKKGNKGNTDKNACERAREAETLAAFRRELEFYREGCVRELPPPDPALATIMHDAFGGQLEPFREWLVSHRALKARTWGLLIHKAQARSETGKAAQP